MAEMEEKLAKMEMNVCKRMGHVAQVMMDFSDWQTEMQRRDAYEDYVLEHHGVERRVARIQYRREREEDETADYLNDHYMQLYENGQLSEETGTDEEDDDDHGDRDGRHVDFPSSGGPAASDQQQRRTSNGGPTAADQQPQTSCSSGEPEAARRQVHASSGGPAAADHQLLDSSGGQAAADHQSQASSGGPAAANQHETIGKNDKRKEKKKEKREKHEKKEEERKFRQPQG